jgi:hypothetical protein
MYILFDGNWNRPEIEISDSASGLSKLGTLFLGISQDLTIPAEQVKSKFYPENLDAISIKLLPMESPAEKSLINIYITNNRLIFEGSKSAFNILGRSLVNFFPEDSKKGDHFHLDDVGGNSLFAPPNYSLIFACTG